jgi:triosephosphate isomerase
MDRRRTPLIAGNWKLNHGGSSGIELGIAVARAAAASPNVDVVVAPPFTILSAVVRECEEVARQLRCRPLGVGAQNLYPEPKGAFTGEVSGPMLREAGCQWVVIGHSERRQYFAEDDGFVAKKASAAFDAGLTPIVCVGETLAERESGKTLDVVLRQLDAVTAILGAHVGIGVIAYEPVWAIGTGKVATPEDAQAVHAAIRERLARGAGGLAEQTRVLYGGSVKADNARDLLSQADIDGALVGGASLSIGDFGPIIQTASDLAG